jgi:hypothetical protein
MALMSMRVPLTSFGSEADRVEVPLPWLPSYWSAVPVCHACESCERSHRFGGPSGPAGPPKAAVQACFAAAAASKPSRVIDFSRISTLRTLPVTVIGNSSTTCTYRGIL